MALQLRASKVTGWQREYEFAKSIGRKWRFDFAWPAQRLCVEIDGGNRMVRNGVAVGRHTSEKDAEKLNTAATMGWRVLRYTPRQVKRGDALQGVLNAIRGETDDNRPDKYQRGYAT